MHLQVFKLSMISIITPTVRPEGLDLVRKALKRQTFKDWEWIVVGKQNIWNYMENKWNDDYPFYWYEEPKLNKDDLWALNKAYNKALFQAKGELIVSWQDYTYAKPDALEKFWFHYQNEPKTLITAVGNKYADDKWIVKTWQDPREREDQGTFYPCFFNDIEFNLCSIPEEALYAVGGFDESLDKFYGMDGFSVVDRLNLLGGYDFKLDQTIKSFSLEHGRLNPKWDELNWIGDRYNAKRLEYIDNPALNYLHS